MEQKKSIFTRESLDKVTSPEKLDDYIRIAGPGIWLLITALLVTAAAVIFWGFTGSLPQSVGANGLVVSSDGAYVLCLVDASEYDSDDLEWKETVITLPDSGTISGTVTEVSSLPFSENELAELFENEWLASRLSAGDYSYLVSVSPEEDLSSFAGKILKVSIITDRIRPISLLFQ